MGFSLKSEDLLLSVFLTQKVPSKERSSLRGYTFPLTNRKWNFHLCSAGTELGKKLLSNLPFLATSQSIKTPPSALSPDQKDSLRSFYPCGFLKYSFGEEGLLRLLQYTLESRGFTIMFPVYTSALLNSIYILM